MKNKIQIINILLVLGMLVSLYLTYQHFVPGAKAPCNFGGSFNCEIVNKSPYANIDGIFFLLTFDYGLSTPYINISKINIILDVLTSNAVLGFLTLLLIMFILNKKRKNQDFLFIKNKDLKKYIVGILCFSVLYGVFLIYIQHFILYAYCPFCLVLDCILILSLILVWKMK